MNDTRQVVQSVLDTIARMSPAQCGAVAGRAMNFKLCARNSRTRAKLAQLGVIVDPNDAYPRLTEHGWRVSQALRFRREHDGYLPSARHFATLCAVDDAELARVGGVAASHVGSTVVGLYALTREGSIVEVTPPEGSRHRHLFTVSEVAVDALDMLYRTVARTPEEVAPHLAQPL